MANTDPILTALAGMEERILQAVGDQLRDFRLEVNGRFDSLEHRMARLEPRTAKPRCSSPATTISSGSETRRRFPS